MTHDNDYQQRDLNELSADQRERNEQMRQEQLARERRRERVYQEAAARRQQHLEQRYGALVDAMTPDERRAMLPAVFKRLPMDGPLVRVWLLGELEKRGAVPAGDAVL
jgi:hypothetical protein